MTNPTPRYFDTRSTFTANPRCYVAREWENDESFAKLAFDYHAQFEPVGPVEIYLVDALVLSDHEKRRVSLMQTQVLENRIAADTGRPSPYGLIYIEDQNGPKLLTKLARQFASLQRTWSQSLKLLERYQRQRHDREAQEAQAKAAAEAEVAEAAPAEVNAAAAPSDKAAHSRAGAPPSAIAPAVAKVEPIRSRSFESPSPGKKDGTDN